MRDVFYTILIAWVVWRIFNSISAHTRAKHTNSTNRSSANASTSSREGETKIDYIPPVKNKIHDDDGEYVDYEEIK